MSTSPDTESGPSLAESLGEVLNRLESGQRDEARQLASERFPFSIREATPRKKVYLKEQVGLFARDKYICRYSGDKLVFPGVLLLLEKELGDCFPAEKNYRVGQSHWVYWMLWPVIDHVEAVATGVVDQKHPRNLVTTSVFRNVQKGHWSLSHMGWLDRGVPGQGETWDGLTSWFHRYMATAPAELWAHRNIADWARAAGMNAPRRSRPTTSSTGQADGGTP